MESNIKFKQAMSIYDEVRNIFMSIELPNGITHIDIKGLYFLSSSGCNDMKSLKEKILQTYKQMDPKKLEVKITKSVGQLIDKDLVKTRRSNEDARIKEFSITNEGQKVLGQVFKLAEKEWKKVNNG